MNKLTVKNKIQKALFLIELQGQISDGMWENASPFNHWGIWCKLEDEDVIIGDNIGKNFYAPKDNYNLSSPALLDCIGDRMVSLCNMIENGYSYDIVNKFYDFYMPNNLTIHVTIGMTNEEIIEKYNNDYWIKRNNEMLAVFGSEEKLNEARNGSYDMKKLRKELSELKKSFKTNS